MKQRIISGIVAAIILICLLLTPVFVIKTAVAVVLLGCMYEALKCFSMDKEPVFLFVGGLSCIVMPFLGNDILKYLSGNVNYIGAFLGLFVVLMCVGLVFGHKKITVEKMGIFAFLLLLIPFCLSHLSYIRQLDMGAFYIWLPILGAFVPDIGAYFVGRFFGHKKLCEEISPKKTVAGSIGGFVGAFFGFFVYSLVLKFVFDISVSYIPYYIIAILCGGLSQIGDLTASMLKRANNVKDFGKIMPGHGGFLDRVDSMIFISPVIYYIITVFCNNLFF